MEEEEEEEEVRWTLSSNDVRFHMEIALPRRSFVHTPARLLPLDLATKRKQTTCEGPSPATKHRR